MTIQQFRDQLDGLYAALTSYRGCKREERANEVRSVVYWLGCVQGAKSARMTERDRARLNCAVSEARRAIGEQKGTDR